MELVHLDDRTARSRHDVITSQTLTGVRLPEDYDVEMVNGVVFPARFGEWIRNEPIEDCVQVQLPEGNAC